jgi:hypothetical protein
MPMHAAVMAGADTDADAAFAGANIHLRACGRSDANGHKRRSDQEQFLHWIVLWFDW